MWKVVRTVLKRIAKHFAPIDATVLPHPNGWMVYVDYGAGMRPEDVYSTRQAAENAAQAAFKGD